MPEHNYRLELMRIGLEWNKSNFNKKINGYLYVYRDDEKVGTFSTMERAINFVHLKVGSYAMRHSKKGNPDGTGRDDVKCLRPIEPRFKTILIHDAINRRPTSLAGCIAPFFLGDEAYQRSSKEAMDALWDMIGGYHKEVGTANLLVLTNAILGDERTQETWKWDSRKKHH